MGKVNLEIMKGFTEQISNALKLNNGLCGYTQISGIGIATRLQEAVSYYEYIQDSDSSMSECYKKQLPAKLADVEKEIDALGEAMATWQNAITDAMTIVNALKKEVE